jgi:ribose 1,5-bisphosphokinase PhnN
LVTAPPGGHALRRAARDRASDASIAERMGRVDVESGRFRADVVINNIGEPEAGARKLLDAVYAGGVFAA